MTSHRRIVIAIAFLVVSFGAAMIMAHGDASRAEQLKNTADPRTAAEKTGFGSRASLEQLAQLNAELGEMKKQLASEDLYACCIHGGCNMCPLEEGTCACRKSLEAGESVCVQCKDAWESGRGSVEGYNADEVKASFGMGHHDDGGEDEDSSHGEHDH